MIKLQDDDRDDWLSRYMDDELSPEERTAVEARIKDNALWRDDFARLQSSTRFVEKVLIKFQTDDGFARSVTSKLTKVDKEKVERDRADRSDKSDKRQPAAVQPQAKQHRALPRPRRHRTENSWLPIFGAAAAVALIAGFVIWNSGKRVTPETPAVKPPPATNQNIIVVKQDVESFTLADGTKVAARRGAEIKKIDDRTVALSGEALFVVAKADRPFTVQSGDGLKIQALGTRFEVSTQQSSAQVRVAEGLVRVQKAGGKSVDARGGMLVTPSLDTRMFDPRELDISWKGAALTESVPFWSQSYGGAAHSGSSPLRGPEDLGNSSSAFFAYPDKIESPETGAVVSAANKAYVIARSGGGNAQLLEVALDGPNRGRWRTCSASNVSPRFSPVLTPHGLVITAAIDGTVSAYEPDTDKTVWTFKEKSMLVGLSSDPREMILVSTADEIVALDSRDGKLVWQTRDVKGFSAPATVLPSGLICGVVDNMGVVLLEPVAGKVVKNVSWPRNMSRPASVTSTNSKEIWLTSGDGYVVRANVDTGEKVEKYFGWQLKCAPIGSGLLGIGSYMMHFDQPAAITAPADDTIVAIAQDGRKEVFAGYQRGIMHLRSATPAAEMSQWRGVGFTNLSKGFMVKDGLAIASGKLVATTSAGIQLFE